MATKGPLSFDIGEGDDGGGGFQPRGGGLRNNAPGTIAVGLKQASVRIQDGTRAVVLTGTVEVHYRDPLPITNGVVHAPGPQFGGSLYTITLTEHGKSNEVLSNYKYQTFNQGMYVFTRI